MGLPNLLALTRKPTLYHSFKKSNNYGGAIAWDSSYYSCENSQKWTLKVVHKRIGVTKLHARS